MVMRMRTVIATLKGWCQCESILIWASLWWTKSLEPKISKWICFCFCHVRSKRQNKNWKIIGMLVGFTTSLGPATRTFFSLLRWLVLVFGYCLMFPWLFCCLCFTHPWARQVFTSRMSPLIYFLGQEEPGAQVIGSWMNLILNPKSMRHSNSTGTRNQGLVPKIERSLGTSTRLEYQRTCNLTLISLLFLGSF